MSIFVRAISKINACRQLKGFRTEVETLVFTSFQKLKEVVRH